MLPRYDLGSREKFRLERLLPDQRYALDSNGFAY